MRHFILVAGVDYESKGFPFRANCDSRMKRILAANKVKEEMTFEIFDVRKGEVVTHEVTYPSGKPADKVTKLTPSPFKSISKANYDRVEHGGETHYRFKDGQTDIMSILDVYKAVQKVGANAPNTLVELSFFSHAWMGGPILVNSYDDGIMQVTISGQRGPALIALPPTARDPDDMDPRASKDFIAPTMDAAALASFQKAFHKDGYVWIWGCAFPRVIHEMLHKIERNPAYKDSGLGDDVVFKIKNFSTDQAALFENVLKDVLGGPFPNKKNIEVKFKYIKYFFCLVTVASYTHHIAKNAKVKAYGAVMGTYSARDSGTLPLWHVYKGFAKHFTFYKNYLGFEFDPEGRKYGIYKPDFACTPPSP
jgi:hypothetical protein